MAEFKPIKRSVYLATLSREHHECLLLGWKIRSAIAKNIASDRIINYCMWFWENYLKNHFKEEEEGFAVMLEMNNPLFVIMMNDHKKINFLLTSMSENLEENHNGLEDFANILSDHVRFEERVLFKHLQETTSIEQLESFAKIHTPRTIPAWQDEFWLN